ncbi:MAG: DNA repair exonuclease [Methanobrevibacter sp.]|jgi:exonuclease SbcD|nr:DNA repair exonuclease [Methanobrevibacter sp.]
MKFAHLADTHLGYRQYGLLEREEDFCNVFEEIIDKIIEERVDFIIHSGDLFETAKPSPNALLVFQEQLMKIKKADIPFYAIAGNHDTIMRQNALPPQVLYKKLGLTLISPNNSIVNSFFLKENNIFIGGTPFIPKSQENYLKDKLNHLSKEANSYSENNSSNGNNPKKILVSHQGIDKYLPFQYELEIADIPTNFNYYAFGHVHNRILDDFGEGKLAFPGSTEIWKVNELADYKKRGKGFYIVDIDEDIPEVESVNIDLPREFILKNIEYSKFTSEIIELERYISSLKNKPILNLTIEKGNFNSSDIYKELNKTFSKICLMIRPSFKSEDLINQEIHINGKESLEPRELLIEHLKAFENEDISNLAIDLLDSLSKNKIEESEKIANSFYNEYFGNIHNESNESISKTNHESKFDNFQETF